MIEARFKKPESKNFPKMTEKFNFTLFVQRSALMFTQNRRLYFQTFLVQGVMHDLPASQFSGLFS